MRTRLALWRVCAIATVLASSVASGEFLYDGDWEGGEYGWASADGDVDYGRFTEAQADANGDDYWSYAYGEGWFKMWTTVTEPNATARINVKVEATAWIDLPSGYYGSAEGIAHATGHIAGSDKYISFSASAYVDQDSDPPWAFDSPDPNNPYEEDDDRTGPFTADTGFSCDHDAACYANVEYGGPGAACGTAFGRGEGFMYRGS